MVFDLKNTSGITTNHDQSLILGIENRGVLLLDEFALVDYWHKSSASLSGYSLDFVIAASAVLAFN